jgi:hypothetical protein
VLRKNLIPLGLAGSYGLTADRCGSLVVLARLFDWRDALVVVQPRTMARWHRAG